MLVAVVVETGEPHRDPIPFKQTRPFFKPGDDAIPTLWQHSQSVEMTMPPSLPRGDGDAFLPCSAQVEVMVVGKEFSERIVSCRMLRFPACLSG